MNYSYYSLRFLKEGWVEGRFSFVTRIIFMINKMVLRGLFLDGLAWWNPLKGYPVFTNFLGVLFLLCLSLLLASLIVSNGIVNIKLSKLHADFLCFPQPPVPSLYERCVISFMICVTTICFYACKYKVVKYSLYFTGFLLMVVYCFTGSITALVILWLMTSLQKYCTYVVLIMFDPKKLYLDLTFLTFREHKSKYNCLIRY